MKNINQKIIDILNLKIQMFFKYCNDYKGIRLWDGDDTFFIKFNINDLIHMLGFNRLNYFKKIKPSNAVKLIKRKQVRFSMINDYMISKNDKKVIHLKILSFIDYVDFLDSLNIENINFSIDCGKFKNYEYDGIFCINKNSLLILMKHKNINMDHFFSYSIVSIRNCCFDKFVKYQKINNIVNIKKINLVCKNNI